MKKRRGKKSTAVNFNEKPKRERKEWAGIMPQLGRNLFSLVVADMNNAYVAGAGMFAWIIDVVLWLFLPVIGGFLGIATFIAFESDKLTFHHMGLDQSRLYQGEMLFIKGIVFSAMGRPNFFKNPSQDGSPPTLYRPLRDMNPLIVPVTVTKEVSAEAEAEVEVVEEDSEEGAEEEEEFGEESDENADDLDDSEEGFDEDVL